MIVFLTLLYVGLLVALIKMKVIKPNLFWKLSPVLWMLLLFIALFIPMQWGAPQGVVIVNQTVVEVIPNVTGEVIEVPVEGLTRVEKGAILFKIDPVPFQLKVDEATAGLGNARQQVEQLKEAYTSAESTVRRTEQNVELLQAEQENAEAKVTSAEASLRESEVQLQTASEMTKTLTANVDTAKQIVDRNERLLGTGAIAQTEFDAMVFRYTDLSNQLTTATNDAKVAAEAIKINTVNVSIAETNVNQSKLRLQQLITADLPRVKADAQQAKLARDNFVGDEHALIAAAKARLGQAEFDLTQTVVRAPVDGYAIAVTLVPGQRVASFPVRSWMSFVSEDSTRLVVGIDQFSFRFVKPGQTAEMTFKLYPGRVFRGTVEKVANVSAQGQVAPSGMIVEAPNSSVSAETFGVVLKLTPSDDVDLAKLQGGTVGTATIYTDNAKFSHVIRKVMIRMESWTNYIFR